MKKILVILIFLVSGFVFGQKKPKTTQPESKTLFSGKIIVNAGTGFESEQERLVIGTVTHKNNESLPGVKILIDKTHKGTHTDFDGKYSLTAKPTDTLIFSYPGFKTQKLKAEKNEANIKMDEDVILDIPIPCFDPKKSQRSLLIDPRKNISQKDIQNANDSVPFNEKYSFIIGKWKEIEYHGNNGADDYVNYIENGRILTFEKNGNVWIEKDTIIDQESYEISPHNKHTLRLYISSPKNGFHYLISNQEDPNFMYLTPVTSTYQIICKEGCGYVYERIK